MSDEVGWPKPFSDEVGVPKPSRGDLGWPKPGEGTDASRNVNCLTSPLRSPYPSSR